jgi:hypothetical protein
VSALVVVALSAVIFPLAPIVSVVPAFTVVAAARATAASLPRPRPKTSARNIERV